MKTVLVGLAALALVAGGAVLAVALQINAASTRGVTWLATRLNQLAETVPRAPKEPFQCSRRATSPDRGRQLFGAFETAVVLREPPGVDRLLPQGIPLLAVENGEGPRLSQTLRDMFSVGPSAWRAAMTDAQVYGVGPGAVDAVALVVPASPGQLLVSVIDASDGAPLCAGLLEGSADQPRALPELISAAVTRAR